jgi:hypothetical protein
MDRDPELDVTLSDGRQVATFQIAAVDAVRETWAIVEPRRPPCVIRGYVSALAARQRLDARIAARLAVGWVPVDGPSAGPPSVPPAPLPPDLVLQISRLLEGLTRARLARRAADPSGQLWAACQACRPQAWRFGVSTPDARVRRAWQERRLGELAERAGDRAAAICASRLALASFARVGVTRRLARLASDGPAAATSSPPGPPRVRPRIAGPPASHDSTRLSAARERSCVDGPPARPQTRRQTMTGRIQIVGRRPVDRSRRVRAVAKRRKVRVHAFLIEALTQARGPRRVAEKARP